MTEEKISSTVMLICILLFMAWLLFGCAAQRDMSRREAIDITDLSKEMSK